MGCDATSNIAAGWAACRWWWLQPGCWRAASLTTTDFRQRPAGTQCGEGHGEDNHVTRYGPGTRCRAAKGVRYAAREPDSARTERSAIPRQPSRLGFVALHSWHSAAQHVEKWGSTIGTPCPSKRNSFPVRLSPGGTSLPWVHAAIGSDTSRAVLPRAARR